jgi:Domain of unknown function (DUF4124)
MNKLLIALLLVSSNCFALTKWVDAQGHTHYADHPPTSKVKAEVIKSPRSIVPEIAAASEVPASPAKADPKDIAKAKKEADDKLALEAEQKKIKAANCTASQQNLSNLKDGMRVATVDPKTGERSYLGEVERQQKVTQYQNDVSKYCN